MVITQILLKIAAAALRSALQRIGRGDVVREMNRVENSHISGTSVTTPTLLEVDDRRHYPAVRYPGKIITVIWKFA